MWRDLPNQIQPELNSFGELTFVRYGWVDKRSRTFLRHMIRLSGPRLLILEVPSSSTMRPCFHVATADLSLNLSFEQYNKLCHRSILRWMFQHSDVPSDHLKKFPFWRSQTAMHINTPSRKRMGCDAFSIVQISNLKKPWPVRYKSQERHAQVLATFILP